MINVNDTEHEWHKNMTIQQMLQQCGFTEVPVVMVRVNGVFYEKKDFYFTRIPDEASVRVVHLIHGG